MQLAALPTFLLGIISGSAAFQIPSRFAPFSPPSLELDDLLLTNETSISVEHELLRRNSYCDANYNSCSTFAAQYSGACCTSGTICTTDQANNLACCSKGATCTGTLGTTGVPGATTTTGATTTATGTASFVPNAYFPFPVIPTSYINSAACASAISVCSVNYGICTNDLTGQGYGITISGPDGAGVTQAPTAANVGAASATSICSSLSSQACGGDYTSNCAQYGTATTTGGVFVVGTNAAARPNMGNMAAAGVVAGVGLGMMGQMV